LFLSRSLVGFFFVEPIAALFRSVSRLPATPEIPLRARGGLIRRQARFLGKPVRTPTARNTAAISGKSADSHEISQANA
jgi:hypothetical protein